MSGATTSANGFTRPTIDQLIEQAQSDINANLPGADARLPQSNLDVLSIVAAGLADEQLEAIDFFTRQIHVTTAQGIWLERHGSEWGVIRKQATAATGALAVNVDPGAVIPAGSLFQTRERIQVRTTAPAVVTAGIARAPIIAVERGITGNLADRTAIDTVNPIIGVREGLIDGQMTGGADRERDEPYRNRILDRIQRPPQGGAAHDYEQWSLEVSGVTRAWVYPREQGEGTVIVRFAMDESYPNGIPQPEDAQRLLAYLEGKRPVTAEVFVYIPAAVTVNITIAELNPRNQATEQAVIDELNDLFRREGRPGAGIFVSWIWEAVSIASGVRSHRIIVPPGDVQLAPNEMPVVGTVTFN